MVPPLPTATKPSINKSFAPPPPPTTAKPFVRADVTPQNRPLLAF